MIYTLDELRAKIAPIAEKYHIPAVYVFGSYARGEATEDSDVDLLVDLEGSIVRGFVMGGLYNDLEEGLGKELSLITEKSLYEPDPKRRMEKFVANVLRERISLYERQRHAAA